MNEIAKAIRAGFELIAEVVRTSETRKIQACKEAAEKYIQVNEKNGEFKDIKDKRQKKLLTHYRKRFFAYN